MSHPEFTPLYAAQMDAFNKACVRDEFVLPDDIIYMICHYASRMPSNLVCGNKNRHLLLLPLELEGQYDKVSELPVCNRCYQREVQKYEKHVRNFDVYRCLFDSEDITYVKRRKTE